MSQLDPEFVVSPNQGLRYTTSRDFPPVPSPFTDRRGYPRRPGPTQEELDQWEKVKREIAIEMEKETPTPVFDAVGPITSESPPSEAVWADTVKALEDTYGWDRSKNAYLETTSGMGKGGNWNGGYGANAFYAIQRLEKQLNFFQLNGKTPLEAAVARYARYEELKGLDRGGRRGRKGRATRKGRKGRTARRVTKSAARLRMKY
jgi:hypothetical protein